MSNMSDRRIVVTGLGLICALGDGTDKCWSAASNGITGIREVQSVSTEGCYANKGAEVAESSEQLSGEDYDRSSLLCIKAAGEALADAGYTVTADNSDRIGVIVGNCVAPQALTSTTPTNSRPAPQSRPIVSECLLLPSRTTLRSTSG